MKAEAEAEARSRIEAEVHPLFLFRASFAHTRVGCMVVLELSSLWGQLICCPGRQGVLSLPLLSLAATLLNATLLGF